MDYSVMDAHSQHQRVVPLRIVAGRRWGPLITSEPTSERPLLEGCFCPVDGAPPPGRPRLGSQSVLCAFGKSLGLGADVRTLGL